MSLPFILQQMICGAMAAAGFGVLFNIGFRSLPWCAVTGALALVVRTVCLGWGWSMEAAAFVAALAVGSFVHALQARTDISQEVLNVTGCIPMVPGSFAAKAILGLFSLATESTADAGGTLITAVQYTLRVTFTIGAIGTGLAIPTLLMHIRTARRG